MLFEPAGMNELVGDDYDPDTLSSITRDVLVLFRTRLLSKNRHLRIGVHENIGFHYRVILLKRRQFRRSVNRGLELILGTDSESQLCLTLFRRELAPQGELSGISSTVELLDRPLQGDRPSRS